MEISKKTLVKTLDESHARSALAVAQRRLVNIMMVMVVVGKKCAMQE